MTTEQKSKIISLRNAGYGYAAVAKEIGMSKSAVRKYCQGIGMSGDMEKHATTFPATRQFEDPTTSDYRLSHATTCRFVIPTKVSYRLSHATLFSAPAGRIPVG